MVSINLFGMESRYKKRRDKMGEMAGGLDLSGPLLLNSTVPVFIQSVCGPAIKYKSEHSR
jgi:hypothetical protein